MCVRKKDKKKEAENNPEPASLPAFFIENVCKSPPLEILCESRPNPSQVHLYTRKFGL